MNEDIFKFLSELRDNNYREWFHANKGRFDALKKGFLENIQQLINRIAAFDPEVAGLEAKDCLFRIYRDTRFSKDKTPYKIHLAAFIAKGGRQSPRAGYYIHLEPGGSILSGGIWRPEPDILKALRNDIYNQIEEFTGIMEEPSFKSSFPELEGERLKRNPVGFPDSPYNEIIRLKDFSVVAYYPDDFFMSDDWMDKAVAELKKIHPLNKFLNYTVDEYFLKFPQKALSLSPR
jgi:TIGR02453 family protein